MGKYRVMNKLFHLTKLLVDIDGRTIIGDIVTVDGLTNIGDIGGSNSW